MTCKTIKRWTCACAMTGVLVCGGCGEGGGHESGRDANSTSAPASNVMEMSSDHEVTETSSGLRYIDLVEGTGRGARAGDTVETHYTGWLEDGTKFDSSVDRGTPISFELGAAKVIKGWEEGIVGMRVGSKRKLMIPSHLGYGSRGGGNVIPPDANLIFEVELVSLQ